MTKVEKYIQDYTRGCSNEMAAIKYADGRTETYYHEWLTPENAFSVAEIAKEETLNKVCEYIKENLHKHLYVYNGEAGFPTAQFLTDMCKAMEE